MVQYFSFAFFFLIYIMSTCQEHYMLHYEHKDKRLICT